jgi:glutamate synthase domain-containing protein 2
LRTTRAKAPFPAPPRARWRPDLGIGSGYFGCRNDDGSFNADKFRANALRPAGEDDRDQAQPGAKPGHGGVLPGPRSRPEIAEARGVPEGKTACRPLRTVRLAHPTEMMQFIARLRDLSGGKPVGFKLCIGHPWEWFAMVKAMLATGITPDFIVVDGSEGGTGAAPLEFTDHVGVPLQEGLLLVHNTLRRCQTCATASAWAAQAKWSARSTLPRLMALGADWCNSARGFMMALGCIQAQACHTGHCPTGVTTQDPQRQSRPGRGQQDATGATTFHQNTLEALQELVQAAGLTHPNQISPAPHRAPGAPTTR